MAECVRVRAAAKINLHLRVYGRQNDGFHGILSLFQAVSLADTLVIRSLKESDTIEIDGDFDCPIQLTTVYKAVLAYRKVSGVESGISISVEKRIPAGAGLGGGSSDAAATLLGLESLLGAGLADDDLARLGAMIGSDVPFFLSAPAAVVTGRGEKVASFEPRYDFSLLIAFPGFSVSTAQAYAELDRERPNDSWEADPSAEALLGAYRGEISLWPFANSFEPIVGRSRSEIPRAKDYLLGAGASFAAMTGSGSSVFGIFEDVSKLSHAMEGLEAAGYMTYAASPLARSVSLY
jgi:4-diphosphocytidyl-2-C-methyl-D-erythritol kinase